MTDPEQARSLLRLMDALEELDDVQSVTANFEMAEELLSLSMVYPPAVLGILIEVTIKFP